MEWNQWKVWDKVKVWAYFWIISAMKYENEWWYIVWNIWYLWHELSKPDIQEELKYFKI
mgnify:CR=1 FL=1